MADERVADVGAPASDIAELLAVERSFARTGDDAMKARVLARSRRTLGITPGPSGGGVSSSPAEASTEPLIADVPERPRAPDAPPTPDRERAREALRHTALSLDVLLCAACLLAVVRAGDPSPHRASPATSVAIVAPAVSLAIPSVSASAAMPVLTIDALPDVAAPASPHRSRSAVDLAPPAPRRTGIPADPPLATGPSADVTAPTSDFASERALITDVRESMNRGDYARAERALDEHARRFPHGQLVEQRKALEVWLLEQTGRRALARERAAHFRNDHPNSVMRRALGDGP